MSSYHQAIEIASSSSSTITTTADDPDEHTALLNGSPTSKPSPYLEISTATVNNNSKTACKYHMSILFYTYIKRIFFIVI